MKVVVVAGRVARWPWSPGGIVRDMCLGLLSLGHRVVLVAHSVDDPDSLRSAAVAVNPAERAFRLRGMTTFVEHHTHWPGSAQVRRRLRSTVEEEVRAGAEAVICTTQLLGPVWDESWPGGGRVRAGWLPVEPSPRAWLRAMVRTRWRGLDARCWRSMLTIAAALARHRGVLRMIASGHGDPSNAKADGAPLLDPGGYAPNLPGRDEVDRSSQELRETARRALSIKPERFVLLVSCPASPPMGVGPGLVGLLRACARVAERARKGELGAGVRVPSLVILTMQPFLVHHEELASRMLTSDWAASGDAARLLGATHRMDAALAAADAVVLLPSLGGAIAGVPAVPGVHGRLACDALAHGRLLIGARGRATNATLAPLRSQIEGECVLADDARLLGPESDAEWAVVLERALLRDARGEVGISRELAEPVRACADRTAWAGRIVDGLTGRAGG